MVCRCQQYVGFFVFEKLSSMCGHWIVKFLLQISRNCTCLKNCQNVMCSTSWLGFFFIEKWLKNVIWCPKMADFPNRIIDFGSLCLGNKLTFFDLSWLTRLPCNRTTCFSAKKWDIDVSTWFDFYFGPFWVQRSKKSKI